MIKRIGMLSIILITKNEEATLRRCLCSIQWADEIIIVDAGSTDSTVTIAREFTDKVVVRDDWKGYGVQKQRALIQAAGDWVLNLDADEVVEPLLKNAILAAIQSNRADAYRIPIRMCFYNKLLRYSSGPNRHIRLFKRAGARYSDDIVHEKIVVPANARIAKLSFPLMHYSFRDVSHALYKINRYSSYSAHIRLGQKKPASFFKTLVGTLWMFFRCYLLQRGFLDGREGFLMAVFNAQGTFYRGVKQLYQDVEQEQISDDRKQ